MQGEIRNMAKVDEQEKTPYELLRGRAHPPPAAFGERVIGLGALPPEESRKFGLRGKKGMILGYAQLRALMRLDMGQSASQRGARGGNS